MFLFSEVIAAKNVSTSELEMSLDRLLGRWADCASPLGTWPLNVDKSVFNDRISDSIAPMVFVVASSLAKIIAWIKIICWHNQELDFIDRRNLPRKDRFTEITNLSKRSIHRNNEPLENFNGKCNNSPLYPGHYYQFFW